MHLTLNQMKTVKQEKSEAMKKYMKLRVTSFLRNSKSSSILSMKILNKLLFLIRSNERVQKSCDWLIFVWFTHSVSFLQRYSTWSKPMSWIVRSLSLQEPHWNVYDKKSWRQQHKRTKRNQVCHMFFLFRNRWTKVLSIQGRNLYFLLLTRYQMFKVLADSK